MKNFEFLKNIIYIGIFFSNIIQLVRSNYCYIQNSFTFMNYFTRYGHFQFDKKRFGAFTLIYWLKIVFMVNYFVIIPKGAELLINYTRGLGANN